MTRWDFIAGLSSVPVAGLVATRAQQRRVPRIGMLIGGKSTDPDQQLDMAAFEKSLQDLGWTTGVRFGTCARWC